MHTGYLSLQQRAWLKARARSWLWRSELPTWLLIGVIYGGWFAVMLNAQMLGWLPATLLLIVFTTWYMSMQHELIHGHPTRWPRMNQLFGTLPLAVSGLVPGDTITRAINLTNDGNLALGNVSLAATAAAPSVLTTDAVNGLQLAVKSCAVAWTQTGGPAVTLNGGSTNSASFIAPAVTSSRSTKWSGAYAGSIAESSGAMSRGARQRSGSGFR